MERTLEGALPATVAGVALLMGLVGMALAFNPDVLGMRPGLLVGQLALLAPFALAAAALGLSPRRAFALHPVPPRGLAFSVGCGLGLWVASAGLLQLQYAVWPPSAYVLEFFERLHARLDLWPPWEAALSMLAIAIGPAISEEIAFRGALLGSLRRWLGDAGAVLATAAVFSSIHYQPGGYRIPFTLALGIALGALRLRAGSLLPVIVAHAVLNATTVLVANQFGDVTAPTEPASLASGVSALAVGLAITAAFAWPLGANRSGGVNSIR